MVGEEVVVTDQRVVLKSGIFRRKAMEIPFHQVESVSYDQGILERIFAGGSVRVRGSGSAWMHTPVLANSQEFRQTVLAHLEIARGGNGGTVRVATRGYAEEE